MPSSDILLLHILVRLISTSFILSLLSQCSADIFVLYCIFLFETIFGTSFPKHRTAISWSKFQIRTSSSFLSPSSTLPLTFLCSPSHLPLLSLSPSSAFPLTFFCFPPHLLLLSLSPFISPSPSTSFLCLSSTNSHT